MISSRCERSIMNDRQPLRWEYRYKHFLSLLDCLEEDIQLYRTQGLSTLEKKGTITDYKLCIELAWKTVKDYLQENSSLIETPTPKGILKQAVEMAILQDGARWQDALKARNEITHIYDEALFNELFKNIVDIYLPLLQSMKGFFDGQLH